MKVGDTAYIVESNRYVREVEIRRCSGGMLLVRFTDTGGGIQVKAHRLFATREESASWRRLMIPIYFMYGNRMTMGNRNEHQGQRGNSCRNRYKGRS